MKTEAEAKKCWCPFARSILGDPRNGETAHNRMAGDFDKEGNVSVMTYGVHRCIAGACMAWRWSDELGVPMRVNPAVLADHWKGWTVTDPEPDAQGLIGISPPLPQHGYCGLAGKP